jgi:hypothetical protein
MVWMAKELGYNSLLRQEIYFLCSIQMNSGTHPSSFPSGTKKLFTVGKEAGE